MATLDSLAEQDERAPKEHYVRFRASDGIVAKLNEIAGDVGLSTSATLRGLVLLEWKKRFGKKKRNGRKKKPA